MKGSRKRALVVLSAVLAIPGVSQAATLDFTQVGTFGIVPQAVVHLANATVTSFGDDLFFGAPGEYGETNLFGIVCASPIVDVSCQEDMQIDFAAPVSGLSFGSFGVAPGDRVTISAFLGPTLLGSVVVTTQTLINLGGYGLIDRLYFDDESVAAGIGFGDFSFNARSVGSVPEPASLTLVGLGLAGLAVLLRRTQPPVR